MRTERDYCYTCQRAVPYDKDAVSDNRRREADRAIRRKLTTKEEQKVLHHERDQLRVAKVALEARGATLEGLCERMRAEVSSHGLQSHAMLHRSLRIFINNGLLFNETCEET